MSGSPNSATETRRWLIHEAGNNTEAIRQICDTSANQAPDTRLPLTCGGTTDHFVCTTLLGGTDKL